MLHFNSRLLSGKLGLLNSFSGPSTSFILNVVPFLCRFLTFYPDFQHALVLEPHNKAASLAEKRLQKSRS